MDNKFKVIVELQCIQCHSVIFFFFLNLMSVLHCAVLVGLFLKGTQKVPPEVLTV